MKQLLSQAKRFIPIVSLFAASCQTTVDEEATKRLEREPLILYSHVPEALYEQEQIRAIAASSDKSQEGLTQILNALQSQSYMEAISLCKAYLNKFPGNEQVMSILATTYYTSGDIKKARFFAETVLKGNPDNHEALNLLGIITWKNATIQEDFREALGLFNLASKVGKNSFAPLMNLGYMQMRLGNFEAAMGEFLKASKRCGNCKPSLTGIVIAAQRLGKLDTARESLNQILSKDPQDPHANFLAAVDQIHFRKEPKAAIEHLTSVLDSKKADHHLQTAAREILTQYEDTQE